MLRPKTVIILVGPKGSGKSFVGTLISKELGIPFVRVEPIYLANMRSSRATGTRSTRRDTIKSPRRSIAS
jgi:adenylate kinase family enzyme